MYNTEFNDNGRECVLLSAVDGNGLWLITTEKSHKR